MKLEGRCKTMAGRQQPCNHQLRAAAAGSLVQIDVVNRALWQFAQAISVSRARSADRPAMYGPACTRLCPNPHTATEKALFVAFRTDRSNPFHFNALTGTSPKQVW